MLTGLGSSTLFTRLTARAPAYYTWHLQKNVLGSRTPGLEPRSGPLHCWFSIWLTEAQSHFETLSQYLARLKFAPLAQHILPARPSPLWGSCDVAGGATGAFNLKSWPPEAPRPRVMSVFSSPDIIFITVSPARRGLGGGTRGWGGGGSPDCRSPEWAPFFICAGPPLHRLPNPPPPRCKGLLASPLALMCSLPLYFSSFPLSYLGGLRRRAHNTHSCLVPSRLQTETILSRSAHCTLHTILRRGAAANHVQTAPSCGQGRAGSFFP